MAYRRWVWQACWFWVVAGGSVGLLQAAQAPAAATGNFQVWDRNGDGVLTRDEVPPGPRRLFERVDTNGDGQITPEEHRAGGRQPSNRPAAGRQTEQAKELQRHTIRQTWSQEPTGYDREYVVRQPAEQSDRWPITFLLHGNRGVADRTIGRWPTHLPGHLLVAPQGYERSWNVSTERSKAPDVAFLGAVLDDVVRRYPRADRTQVSVIGSSNGAGMVYRLLIEGDRAVPMQAAVGLVSSMTTGQFHEQRFWKRADETTDRYDTLVVPAQGRRILTVHGTADTVVPYAGGRGPGGIHLPAQQTAYAWAAHQGYRAAQISDDQGTPCGDGLVRYDYPEVGVRHIKVLEGRHGFGARQPAVQALVAAWIQAAAVEAGSKPLP
jgi:poly(3-hydroxybutyrate) depolymerase